MNLANLLLDISSSDLKSAKLLHKNGHYRTSYFFFQQSVEKANKAFGLYGNLISEEDLSKIQHNQFKIYYHYLKKQEEKNRNFIKVLELFPKVKNHKLTTTVNFQSVNASFKKTISFIDGLHNQDLIHIPETELKAILKEIKEIVKTELKLPKNAQEKFRERMYQLADWIEQFGTPEGFSSKKELEELLNDSEKSKEFYNVMKTIIPFTIDILFIHSTLSICAYLTIQHSSITRYPVDDINPLALYNAELSLIRMQPKFMKVLEKAIDRLRTRIIENP